ncbi:hypothetical protein [Haladaptatus salinisoli]|uniref:hypothetical protein n=1 Tax=Haladaptatus salinisoli TaxID=2884876 RepID=UPI001D0BE359|nr:hypothetical protein [Haladaptatus salinisoli]
MDDQQIEAFETEVRSGVERLKSAFESSESFEEVSDEAEKLWTVLDEGEDVLDQIDLADVPDIVDAEDASEAVDDEDVPKAISEGDPKEAIDARGLVKALELRQLWESADVRELWREAREFEDAVDDLGGDSEDGGDGGMLSGTSADVGGADVDDADVESEVRGELYQAKIQSELQDSVETFREKLIETRNELAAIKAENESIGGPGQPNSRNPTAYSSVARSRTDMGSAGSFSTVPRETKYSSAPNTKRIYGDRFEEENDG